MARRDILETISRGGAVRVYLQTHKHRSLVGKASPMIILDEAHAYEGGLADLRMKCRSLVCMYGTLRKDILLYL